MRNSENVSHITVVTAPYNFKFFKGCFPQISLGPFLSLCTLYNHMAQWNLFDVVNSVILKIPAVLKFPADDL